MNVIQSKKIVAVRTFISAFLIAASICLVGCGKAPDLSSAAEKIMPQSGEKEFMSQMQGRWSFNNAAMNLVQSENKLFGLESTGTVFVMTPTGKLDAVNHILPIKLEVYTTPSEEDVWEQVGLLACSRCDIFGLIGVIKQLQVANPEALKLEGLSKGKENLFASANDLRKKMKIAVSDNRLLYNAAQSDKSMQVSFKDDSGNVLANFSFVRALNDEEKNSAPSLNNKLDKIIAERNANIDKVFNAFLKNMEAIYPHEAAQNQPSVESAVPPQATITKELQSK